MKKLLILALAFSLSFFLAIDSHAAKRTKIQAQPQKKSSKVAPVKRKPRVLKYVSPPESEIQIDNVPLTLPIAEDAIAALSKGKIGDAERILRSEPLSARSLHIIRDIKTIKNFKTAKKTEVDKHRTYQNLGVAYNNLFLFLKRNQLTQKDFFKNALKNYNKAIKLGTEEEAAENRLLVAALYASSGDKDRAKKEFAKIDPAVFEGDYTALEYIALYHCQMGDTSSCVNNLRIAHSMKPRETFIWIAISDDFYNVESEPEFKAMMADFYKDEVKFKQAQEEKSPKKKKGSKPKKPKALKRSKAAKKTS